VYPLFVRAHGPVKNGRKRMSSKVIAVVPSGSGVTVSSGNRANARYVCTSGRARAAESRGESGGFSNAFIRARRGGA